MHIHLIAIGGAAMHNIALELLANGHTVTGSDDEIYEPSRSRLAEAGILPKQMGWHPDLLSTSIDIVILGMHARIDNPELSRAKELGLRVMSYPEFVYDHAKDKKRVVIAGSHGKTTTTSIVLHVLKAQGIDFDYLVGAQIDGFDRMVRFSDAPIMVIEGDEYLSSPVDRRPKILHYKPQLSVITGIAWDHINVFKTFDDYCNQFALFLDDHPAGSKTYYYSGDERLARICQSSTASTLPYDAIQLTHDKKILLDGKKYDFPLVGNHNQQNVSAAWKICSELGISDHDFVNSLSGFTGASKRLQRLKVTEQGRTYLDFAHAPSKVLATVTSVKEWYGGEPLVVVLELHTYSSLNKEFLPQYKGALDAADEAYVIYNNHTLEIKKMPPLSKDYVGKQIGISPSHVLDSSEDCHKLLDSLLDRQGTILLMSSGNFGKYPIERFTK